MQGAELAMLLLCCRLGEAVQPLRQRELTQLARLLQKTQCADKMQELTAQQLEQWGVEESLALRTLRLLERPEQPDRYLQQQPDIVPLTRISEAFPQRLHALKGSCPAVLFCRGELSLLQQKCVALVGSRALDASGQRFAQHIGRLAAREGWVLVSGNASGADRTAQEACLEAGGRVIAFVADRLADHAPQKGLLYISDEGWDCGFSPARALRRNQYIHALGEKSFVAQCPYRSGGTWEGTRKHLRRRLSPVYVRPDSSEGICGLLELGALPLDENTASIGALKDVQLSIFD